ncbi:SCO family protein [Aliifodinibius sp. S!AR15-10]|uniref:SCO family protein n=1 Tax=Aliifodinibius sp. S!AR15-10 TaxID=2950437 RepID=UPI0028666E80|nr:SCO family protein [Aliifodinibius sp. S!AR15-10]MDR8390476.1 SCO family protein [Aliifodinibius sp. S!AR15-10]
MTLSRISFVVFVLLGMLMTGCNSPEVLDDLGARTWKLVDQDSTAITFPDDFKGKIIVTGYIFTNCPGVCPAITANMKKISSQISDMKDVHFVGITFDPMRDRPSVLREYMNKFDLSERRFTFLTGDSATVYSLLDRVGIRTEMQPDTTAGGYRFNHTNQINLIDRRGRTRTEYGGSMVPPEHVVEDINKLQ